MNFPEKTQLNKIYNKAKFLKMSELSTVARNEFNANVDRLILANILRKDTLNIEPGENIKEIKVLEISLKDKNISDNLIKEIDSTAPRIIYCLRIEDDAQIIITYKEKNLKINKYKVIQLYKSAWQKYDKLNLKIEGLNLDTVYENFIKQVAGNKIEIGEKNTLKEAVVKSVDQEKLLKKIKQLENKMNNEKQFNKKLDLKNELKVLKQKLGDL